MRLFGTGLSKPLAAPFDWLAEVVNAVQQAGSRHRHSFLVSIATPASCSGVCEGHAHRNLRYARSNGASSIPNSKPWTGEVHVIRHWARSRVLVEEYRKPGGGDSEPRMVKGEVHSSGGFTTHLPR